MDGWRLRAAMERDTPGDRATIRLLTKSDAEASTWFPEVTAALSAVRGGTHLIDGEICVIRPDGTADFNRMQERGRRRRWWPGAPGVTFCVFDLLIHDGEDIMQKALVERKARLAQILEGIPKAAVFFLDALPCSAQMAAAIMATLPVEGLMAKLASGPYRPGVRSDDWRKIKRRGWREGREWR